VICSQGLYDYLSFFWWVSPSLIGETTMSRTVRKDMDGKQVHDGKAYKAWNIRSDGAFVKPYSRSETKTLLRDEILQYIRENGGSTTTQILDYFGGRLASYETTGWIILGILDELQQEGLIE
jgi:hypothetical protein